MDTNVTIDRVREAVRVIEDHRTHPDYQRIDEILPIALSLLKYKASDMEAEQAKTKYYVPVWIDTLLDIIGNSEEAMDGIDRYIWASQVADMSMDDFKVASGDALGYKTKYMTNEEIRELISSLKTYFNVR